jgi:hypothetical protein
MKLSRNQIVVGACVVVVILAIVFFNMNTSSEGMGQFMGSKDSKTNLNNKNALFTLQGKMANDPIMYSKFDGNLKALLPKYDAASKLDSKTAVNTLLKNQNFALGSQAIPLNSVSTSRKIPYYDLRSLPVIPSSDINALTSEVNKSPYQQAPDNYRAKVVIGG